MQAMILAAGFGTRLLPHTAIRPKPLFPILNQPLLLLTIKRLQRFGCNKIIVNCHHLRQQVIDALKDLDGVIIQEEEKILGTGGGLRKALRHMDDEPLLVTNGDIYHTIDFQRLYSAHQEKSERVTLAMHDYPRFNKVAVKDDLIQTFSADTESESLAFTGVQVLDPDILEQIAEDRESCIVRHYASLLQQGVRLRAFRVDECFWTDMGTVKDYLRLHEGLLCGSVPRWREIDYTGKDPILMSESARLSGNTSFSTWCAIGAVTGRNTHLSKVVIWDGVELPDGFSAENTLISQSPPNPRGKFES